MKNKYDIVYSIGHDCACSMYLRKHNLRVVSGPLDWLTSVPAHNRFDLLLNDFEGFMNQDDFQFVEKNPNIVNDDKCDYYKNTRTGLYFYHDFPVNVPLDQSFPDVKKKYKRRIDRFYQNIKKHKRVLLVWFSHYHRTSDEQWIWFLEKFCQKMGKNIDLLVVQHTENQYQPIRRQIADNIVVWELHTVEKDTQGNNTTIGNEKLCSTIFSQYRLNVPRDKRLKYIWKICVLNTFCKFMPHRNFRHNWRRKIKSELNKMIVERR